MLKLFPSETDELGSETADIRIGKGYFSLIIQEMDPFFIMNEGKATSIFPSKRSAEYLMVMNGLNDISFEGKYWQALLALFNLPPFLLLLRFSFLLLPLFLLPALSFHLVVSEADFFASRQLQSGDEFDLLVQNHLALLCRGFGRGIFYTNLHRLLSGKVGEDEGGDRRNEEKRGRRWDGGKRRGSGKGGE